MSYTLNSKDIDKMFNSTRRMSISTVVPPIFKIRFWKNRLSLAKHFPFKSQAHIEHLSAKMSTPSALDSLLLAKVSKITLPSNAYSCDFLNWGYVYSAKPSGNDFMNFA